MVEVKRCRKLKVVMGDKGKVLGERGLPSSSSEGGWGLSDSRDGWASLEVVPLERRWRGIGGGIASSIEEADEWDLGDVGERGGWSERRWQ